jgi:hypothetical protein
MSSQIKSKKRVASHGEVFTNEREVNAMLDLVKSETERIDSRFLEPACGSGNFLIEILRRKLDVVKQRYKKSQADYERYAVIALCSCYGVDILEDNCQECQKRLFAYFEQQYKTLYKNTYRQQVLDAANFIIDKNIICGDALTMKAQNGQPIVFSEWTAVNGTKMKRKDFTLANLLETENYYAKEKDNQENFFSLMREQGTDLITPEAIADYPIMNYDEIQRMEEKKDLFEN